MGLFDLFNSNKRKWLSISLDSSTPSQLRSVIDDFFIKDNIDYDKYNLNEKVDVMTDRFSTLESVEKIEGLSIYSSGYDPSKRANRHCTPTYREHYSENKFNRGIGVRNWFYIGYPDVALWIEKNFSEIEKMVADKQSEFEEPSGGFNNRFYRFAIDLYKSKTGKKLECSH